MWAVCKKELQNYFYSPVGYVFLAIFMLISAILFFNINLAANTYGTGYSGKADYSVALQNMTIYLSFITPVLTMRIFAEERRNKTDQLYLTSPISITSVVLGKYFAALAVLLMAMVLNLIFPIVIAIYTSSGSLSAGMLAVQYVGFFLIGATFMAMGVFISSLTESQVVAAVISFAIAFIVWLGNNTVSSLGGGFAQTVASSLNMLARYQNFADGIVGFSSFVYYISISGLFVFLTVRSIERRRWTGV